MHDIDYSPASKVAFDESVAIAMCEVLKNECTKHKVWPADVLNWETTKGPEVAMARFSIYTWLIENTTYMSASRNKKGVIRLSRKYGSPPSQPAAAALLGCGCASTICKMVHRFSKENTCDQ